MVAKEHEEFERLPGKSQLYTAITFKWIIRIKFLSWGEKEQGEQYFLSF